MKKIYYLPLLFLLIATACDKAGTTEKLREELLNTDRKFSERSKEVGNQQAFLEYAASDAVLLKQNQLPIIGRRDIRQHFSNQSDKAYVLTWKPSYAKIAESGDLGYTYGIYTMKVKNNPKELYRGTYVTIWEKNKKGKWRFVLDSGNSGIGKNQD